jgi:hypothetical protein
VSETKNGYPQFVVRIKATEFYDETTQTWTDWSSYEQEITGYLVLYTKDPKSQTGWKELLSAQQCKKVFGWNGADFAALANGQYANTLVLCRVEASEYNGATTLKLQWIDAADADPIRQLPKYDTAKLADLSARFAGILATPAATPAKAPAAAPAAKPAAPKRGRPPKAVAPLPPADGLPLPPSEAGAPVPPAAPPTTSAPAAATAMTKDRAWMLVCTNGLRTDEAMDEKIGEVWLNAVTGIGKDETAFVADDWAQVAEKVIAATSKF